MSRGVCEIMYLQRGDGIYSFAQEAKVHCLLRWVNTGALLTRIASMRHPFY